jgi:hypothetical protein
MHWPPGYDIPFEEQHRMNSPPKLDPLKKPYRAPSLQQYGDLARITRTVDRNGQNDGGKGNMARTAG